MKSLKATFDRAFFKENYSINNLLGSFHLESLSFIYEGGFPLREERFLLLY